MYYYEVLVTTNKYHGRVPLTYASQEQIEIGKIVQVPMRGGSSTAIIYRLTGKPKFATKEITTTLVDKPLPQSSLQLFDWLQQYYPSSVSVAASQLVPADLLKKHANTAKVSSAINKHIEHLPKLTSQQASAIQIVQTSHDSSFLLHGITGSGKTRVYSELAKQTLESGKSVVILTPEISLTPQLKQFLDASLDAEVLLIHSNLSAKARRELWLQILYSDQPLVIVGPRSALFSPLHSLGLIVLDEFHDTAYKQEQSPYYHALRVAGALNKIHGSKLVYGSATPSISEYYIAEQRGLPIITLDTLAKNSDTSAVITVVDSKNRQEFGKNPYFSDQLLQSIQKSLDNNEQALVFLNRRGTARLVACQTCDWQALCPQCDLPLTYHGDTHSMRCHTCGHKNTPPLSCPVCHGTEILYKSFGTKAIEAQLSRLFPEARIKRFDTDNTKSERFDQHYGDIVAGDVDILVGTQLLVKGLDLPKLSTVGVVAADSSLYFPDYTADEQTFQLMTQVIGRVARGHRAGSIIVQTRNPNGVALLAAVKKDWSLFYKQQIIERRQFLYPPFCYLLKLTCSRKSIESAAKIAQKLAAEITSLSIKAQIIGPSPRFIEKTNGNYNWQIIVKSKQRQDLLKIIEILPTSWYYDIDPSNLL